MLIVVGDRLSPDEVTWGHEFIEASEFGLALEMMADWLADSESLVTDEERAAMLRLVQDMQMDGRVARALEFCPRWNELATRLLPEPPA